MARDEEIPVRVGSGDSRSIEPVQSQRQEVDFSFADNRQPAGLLQRQQVDKIS